MDIKAINEKHGVGVKTLDGWYAFAETTEKHSWSDYCKPGDFVDEEVYDYFLDLLPPRSMKNGYLQVGEPADSRCNPKTGRFENTYATFRFARKLDDAEIYQYLGNCFAGGACSVDAYIAHKSLSGYLAASRAPRLLDADGSRERLFCKDGFSISVQAGKEFYCAPREDRADGVFETVELGLPSSVEEDILPYAESKKAPTKSVYPFVPVEVVEAVIRKHGGFFESRMQVVEAGASAEASD